MRSVLEAIGNTPLVELSRLTRSFPGRILLKLDYLNPALQLLRGEARGQTIVTIACDSGLKYLSTDLWPQC